MKTQSNAGSKLHLRTAVVLLAVIFCSLGHLIAQSNDPNIDLIKTVEPNPDNCNQFDVTLTVDGMAPDVAQEVVLVIDRSGSMGFEIGNTNTFPIDFAKDAAIDFVQNFFDNNPTGQNRVAIVSYSSDSTIDYPLSGSADEQDIIDAINDLNANGGTNIAAGMNTAENHLDAQGTFNCASERSIILLTDGVATIDLGGAFCGNDGPPPPYPANNTVCMNEAIAEGQDAWVITKNGEDYEQSVFSIGLFGAIDGDDESAATHVLDEVQNEGLFITEAAADLQAIYDAILNQLGFAAKDAIVTDTLPAGFEIVSFDTPPQGSVSTNPGNNVLTWDIGNVTTETLTLQYLIEAVTVASCG